MPIFGQVWLWSSLAFLLGAFLCWVLVARPARRRVGELEDELVGRHRRAPMSDRPSPAARHRALDDEYDEYEASRGDRYGDRPSLLPDLPEEPPEPLTRAYALPTRAPGETNRPGPLSSPFGGIGAPAEVDRTDTELADSPETTQYLPFSAGSLGTGKLEAPPEIPSQPGGRGWFDSEAEQKGEPLEAISRLAPDASTGLDRLLVDDEAEAPPVQRGGGTIFTEHTHPIPGEMIRQIDEAGKVAARTDEPADALVDDLADEDAGSRAEQTLESGPAATPRASVPGIAPGPEVTSQPRLDAEPTGTAPAYGAQGQTEVMPAATFGSSTEVAPASGQRSGAETSRRGTDEPNAMPGVTARQPASSSNPLPKRVPGKPRGHTPFGVQTSPTSAPADPAAPAAEPARALFEPIVPAEDNPVVPPPHVVRGNGRSPFGPGSAMPLPGGASPSPEFTIKASVSALRYCTPESPQFGRTVAEVWFKTSADAERVGFRPVS
ncbi:MAG TPA: hypothetical protein VGP26_01620 [Actinophytocola sp.]|jgi:hypothetical protein|nr:hypothetical protein [Actinophytocola sp.]